MEGLTRLRVQGLSRVTGADRPITGAEQGEVVQRQWPVQGLGA